MIFDSNYVTGLVEKWKVSKDPKLLEVILDQSKSLIEAIISGYDYFYREDLIQEASLRLQYALPYFDPKKANLHTYLTTVIKNICLTYLKKQSKYAEEYSIELYEIDYDFGKYPQDSLNILEDLIVRNRIRFPSIPAYTLDEASEFIVSSLEDTNKRTLPKRLAEEVFIDINTAKLIYASSLLYLKSKYFGTVYHEAVITDEFSITRDIEEIFGKDLGSKIITLFSGIINDFH